MLKSPLRYPGGKAKFFLLVSQIIADNKLFNHTYCEPYAGGAGLALKLLETGFVPSIRLNDINPSISAFWRATLERPDQLCELIEKTPVTVAQWHKQREIRKTARRNQIVPLGFATFFLNRTSRSGILDGSGPIGGLRQDGPWKIDARYNRVALIDTIQEISRRRDCIEFSSLDALDFIKNHVSRPKTFTYLDPPYYVKGYKLYQNSYKHDDHVEIAKSLLRRRKSVWLLSYDNAPEISELYNSFKVTDVQVNYSAGINSLGDELVVFSDKLVPPTSVTIKNPSTHPSKTAPSQRKATLVS